MPDGYPHHKYAQRFPMDDGKPMEELSKDIAENGLREPIVLLVNEILDGRRRERACFMAEVEPWYRQFGDRPEDGIDPRKFVVSLNINRRHLSTSERAMIAVEFAADYEEEALERQKRGTLAKECDKGRSTEKAAEIMNVSARVVVAAIAVKERGTPELNDAVMGGVITVSDAARIADEPAKTQRQAIQDVEEGKAPSAAEALRIRNSQRDRTGKLWPRHILPAIEASRELNRFRTVIAAEIEKAKALQSTAMSSFIEFTPMIEQLERARKACLNGAPAYICPYCTGGGKASERANCMPCKGGGWVTEKIWKQSPAAVGHEDGE